MDKNKAWEIFASTGKVQDYLNFKSLTANANSPFNTVNQVTENNANEKDKDRRTDNKTTEYR